MPAHPVPRTASPAFKAWVWLLLCAVLLQGGTGAVVQVLGRSHSHQTVRAASAAVAAAASSSVSATAPKPLQTWADTLLAWRAARLQTLQASAVFRHHSVSLAAHHHDGLERHHHGPGDTSVAAVDRGSSDATADTGQASAGAGLAAPWGPTAEHRMAPAVLAGALWPVALAVAWSSALTRLPERPPKA